MAQRARPGGRKRHTPAATRLNKAMGNQMTGHPRWYALSVKHQHEHAAEIALGWKGFEALAIPHNGAVLDAGVVRLAAPASELLDSPDVGRLYLGAS